MPIYYVPFFMDRNHNEDVTFRLKVEETPILAQNKSNVTATIEGKNTSGSNIQPYEYSGIISVNGSTLVEKEINKSHNVTLIADGEFHALKYMSASDDISHNSNGEGDVSVTAEIEADEALLSLMIPLTKGSASFSTALTSIDLSAPTITDFSISANRYGLDAGVSFTAAHASYAISDIEFILYGLTASQAQNRVGKATQADRSRAIYENSAYTLNLQKWKNLSESNSIFFDLDSVNETDHPLDSGGSYSYSLTITALNGKTATLNGVLIIPQKVTGISCESQIELNPNQTVELSYSVFPVNAEEQSVIFESSDPNVATVDSNGVVTAVSEGPCIITVTTVDRGSPDAASGFTATCSVNVLDTTVFPLLTSVVDYFTVNYFNRIIFAADFVRDELIEKGIDVSELNIISLSGRNEPVINIMPALISMESNCQRLKESAEAGGIITESLPENQLINKQNTGWIFVINNWIAFLNELHTKINGG